MGEVLNFPTSARVRPVDGTDARRSIDNVRSFHTDEISEILMEDFFTTCEIAGFDFSDDSVYLKDLALVIQAFKSILRKHHGLEHPLQSMAEAALETDDQGTVFFREVLTKLSIAEEV